MANTSEYKKIEFICLKTYYEKKNIEEISLSRKEQRKIFGKMELDIVGYSKIHRTLYLGEFTASGYFGRNGKKFHIGANRKLSESFVKLYICNVRETEIKKYLGSYRIDAVKYIFAVPKGSLFLEALPYHKELFGNSFLELEEIEIEREMIIELEKSYRNARQEIKGSI